MAGDGLSDNAQDFVEEIDRKIVGKYEFSLQEILADPKAIATKPNPEASVAGIKKEVNQYFDEILADYGDEQKEFTKQLQAANSLSSAINDAIKSKFAGKGIPIISPVTVDRDTTKEETIIVSAYDQSVESLIIKLASISNFVADTSTKYNNYTIGSWFFSGEKSYTLAVNPPISVVLNIESARAEINERLDAISQSL
ncbi:MAG: hypothetical protein KGH59_03400 [Candidatus Micrarchaeota archaeon]|nr:hypothetical protein [Candidatus Micrarchaeota archaeon]MDE1804802.1 hypothetical protein [Candidatus Micrarchaeota archaeon]MDE1846881.1 hypothetical protein [Candidatus Micrarchaeota archaeon]